ncbi:MAG: YfhO family protein, partial [bacterium]
LANIHHCTIGRAIIENGEGLNNGMPRYSIKVLEDRSGSLMVKVKTDRKSYLVITETFYPGWKGFIDGKEEKVVPANLLFQALLIPKGEHIVRVAYRPISYKLGLYISLLFSSFIIAFLLSFKRRGKEEKSLKGKA